MAYLPSFAVSARLVTLVEEIAALRTSVLAATVQVPWIPRLQKDARVRNTHSSTAIEGNPLTRPQVLAIEEGRAVPAIAARSEREVRNYLAGLRYIEKNARRRRITHRDVLRLHGLIAGDVMDQGEPGKYRAIPVWVGSLPMPEPSQVSGLVAELLDWWNTQSAQWSPVISSAVIHYRFEEIHPFGDGNGRTGRALALWELYRRGFDSHHIFSVDEYYEENRPRYYDALRRVRRQNGDLTDWLEYCAEGVKLTLERVWMRVQRLAVKGDAGKVVLKPKQELLLSFLRDRQAMTPREIRTALGVSKQGALDSVKPLVEAGLVRRVGTRKSGKYILA